MAGENDTHNAEQEKEPGKHPPWWKQLWVWTGFGEKKLWDWLQLLSALAIPVVIAAASFWFTAQQGQRQQQIEDHRAEREQKIENQRAEAERELEEQRAQDEALQAYLDQMSELLLEKDLRNSEEDSEVRTLARARTLAVLGRLDPGRKTEVMWFLLEADLVGRVDGREPVIGLYRTDLSETDLSGALLSGALLNDADLSDTNLAGADLSSANLPLADLSGANLRVADLSEAFLIAADLSDANLDGADLSDAEVGGVDFGNADLIDANLTGANLTGANFTGADLVNVKGITGEALEEQARSLQGAVMPDGRLRAGRHLFDEFEPTLSFRVSDGWQLFEESEETSESLLIEGPVGGQLYFTNPSHVFDPSNRSAEEEVPEPENANEWISWFQRHPNLDTSDPVPISMANEFSGWQIDVTSISAPEDYPQDYCGGQPCVPLFPIATEPLLYGGSGSIAAQVETKDRFVIVDIGDETLVVNFTASADKFDEFLPKAQKVLDTVEWKGA